MLELHESLDIARVKTKKNWPKCFKHPRIAAAINFQRPRCRPQRRFRNRHKTPCVLDVRMPKKKLATRALGSDPQSLELVEVVDRSNRPLVVMPLAEAHRQSLCHRAVLVLVFNRENKVYLQKRHKHKPLYPGRWDLSATGHIKPDESRKDAALRELYEELGLTATSLKLKQELAASPETGFEFISLFTAGLLDEKPRPNLRELETGHFFDRDELCILVEQFRELLTPGLVYFSERDLIFESKR